MPDYRIQIIVEGQDAGATGLLGSVNSGLGGMLQIAGGILSADVFRAIADGIGEIATEAFNAVGDMQMLTMSLESLTAMEMVKNSVVTSTSMIATQATDEQIARSQWLKKAIDDQTASLSNYEMGSDAYVSAKKKIAGLQTQVNLLGITTDGLIWSQQSSSEQTKTFADVIGLATPKAQELLGWMRDLSVTSPFEYKQVADVFRYNASMGQSIEISKQTTKGMLDFASAVGLQPAELDRFAYALAQTGATGKITAADLRQFGNARFGINQLAGVFGVLSNNTGVAIKDHNAFNEAIANGKITVDDFYKAFSQYSETNFGGAAQRMTQTLPGMMSNLKDIKFFALADMFGPIGDKASAILSPIVNDLAGKLAGGSFKAMGQNLLGYFNNIIDFGTRLSGMNIGALVMGVIPPEIVSALPSLQMGFQNFMTFAQTIGPVIMASLGNTFTQIGAIIGTLASYIIPWLLATFNQVSVWFVANGPLITAFIAGLGAAFVNIIGAVANMWQIIQPLVSGAVAIILGLATTIMAAFTGNWTLAWSSFMGAVQALVTGLQGAFQGLANWICQTFFGTTWQGVLATWQNNIALFVPVVNQIWTQIKGKLGEWAAKFTSVGKDVINGIISGIKSSTQQLYDTLVGILAGLWEKAKAALGINSPSKVYMGAGSSMGEGLAIGIQNSMGLAQSALLGGLGQMTATAYNRTSNDQRTIYYGSVNNYYGGDGSQIDLLRSKRI
jgi:tape measure domain-containing protein